LNTVSTSPEETATATATPVLFVPDASKDVPEPEPQPDVASSVPGLAEPLASLASSSPPFPTSDLVSSESSYVIVSGTVVHRKGMIDAALLAGLAAVLRLAL